MRMSRFHGVLIALGLLFPLSFVSAGTILSDHKYAWSNNVGYINFENVTVSDSALSGYAWSQNTGWIKFNPALGGVVNDGQGDLSGYAWGSGLGWIDFGNVQIDPSTGQFSGTATGDLVGTINFDCPNYCDVKTDWTTASSPTCSSWIYSSWSECTNGVQTRSILTSSPPGCINGSPVTTQTCTSGGGGLSAATQMAAAPIPSNVITSNNQDLTLNPLQSGQYRQNTPVGDVVIDVPTQTAPSTASYSAIAAPLTVMNQYLVSPGLELVNNAFYTVVSKDQQGVLLSSFSFPITVTLPVSQQYRVGYDLALYWLNDVNRSWVLSPEAVFHDGVVTFQTSHPATFAIFAKKRTSAPGGLGKPTQKPIPEPSLPIPATKQPTQKPSESVLPGGSGATYPAVSERSFFQRFQEFFKPVMTYFRQVPLQATSSTSPVVSSLSNILNTKTVVVVAASSVCFSLFLFLFRILKGLMRK